MNTTARVTVEKINARKYRVFSADGAQSKDFPSKKAACSAAYSYARYTLGNQSMFLACTINAVGFKV